MVASSVVVVMTTAEMVMAELVFVKREYLWFGGAWMFEMVRGK